MQLAQECCPECVRVAFAGGWGIEINGISEWVAHYLQGKQGEAETAEELPQNA